MARPRLRRRIGIDPEITYFKPQGVPLRGLAVVELDVEELEALRLRHSQGLDQTAAAARMDTSQSTYQRILGAAGRKLTDALLNGKAIKIVRSRPE